MSQVVSFENYFPPRRFDSIPWTTVQIEESSAPDGPWVLIDTITLDPVDTNPARPQGRNITTELATDTPNLWYRVIFVDATDDVSQPSDPVQNLSEPDTSRDYITREQLKASLELLGMTFADDDIDTSISAASRAVDFITNRRFWKDTEQSERTYIPRWSRVEIDDAVSVDLVEANMGDSTVELVENRDYVLLPLNALADGQPYSFLQFLSTAVLLPDFRLPSLTITGTFGWPALPAGVITATTILATRYLRRQREAPFGIVTVGIEQGAVARISQTDPDVHLILEDLSKGRVLIG